MSRRIWLAAGLAATLLAAGCASATAGHSAGTTPPAPATATAAAHHQRQTVTYVVTGSPADVTWGPSGSSHQGSVPLHVTRRLGNPLFYSISAQLSGGGSVHCAIKINGKTVSRAGASGSFQIASCEVSKNPLTGRWEDTNTGA